MHCLGKDKSVLGFTGQICILIGAIIIIFIGSFLIIVKVLNLFSISELLNCRIYQFSVFDNISYGILYIIIGLIALWISLNGNIYHHNRELLSIIVFIILGLIVETIGGLIMIIGSILLLIVYIF